MQVVVAGIRRIILSFFERHKPLPLQGFFRLGCRYQSYDSLHSAEVVGGAEMHKKPRPEQELTDEEKQAYQELAIAAKRVQDLRAGKRPIKAEPKAEVVEC